MKKLLYFCCASGHASELAVPQHSKSEQNYAEFARLITTGFAYSAFFISMRGCDILAEEQLKKRSRGRPKGTGGNKRPDRKEALSVYSNPGDNTRYVKHNLRVWEMQKPDMTDLEAVNDRISEYLNICMEDDIKPSIEGMALAFSVDRKTLWCWANGVDSKYLPDEVRTSIKKVYQFLNTQFVTYAQDGKMDRTVAIFLMKNNYGYKDEQEVILKPDTQLGEQKDPDELQRKYLEDVHGGATIVEGEATVIGED